MSLPSFYFLPKLLKGQNGAECRFVSFDPSVQLYHMALCGAGTVDSSEAMLSQRSSINRIFSGVLDLLISAISLTCTVVSFLINDFHSYIQQYTPFYELCEVRVGDYQTKHDPSSPTLKIKGNWIFIDICKIEKDQEKSLKNSLTGASLPGRVI